MKSSIRLFYRTATLFSIIFLSVFTAFSQTSWRGTTSTSWGTAANWTSGVPTAGIDAIIGDANFTGANQPTVNVASVCKSLTIGTGTKASTLTVSSNLTISGGVTIGANGTITHSAAVILSLTGNWSNSGTYSATNNGSTVTFAGTTQSLTGATTFRTMTVNAGSTLTLSSAITANSPLTVNGTLDPGTVLVTLNNNFVVNSGATIRVNTALYASNYSIDPTTLSGGSTVEYSSTSTNQILNSGLTYGTLLLSGSMTKFLIGNLPPLNSAAAANGKILVTGGTLDLLSFTANRGVTVAGGTLSVSNGATLKVGGTNSLPANFATHSFGPSSTVQYNGTTQSVNAETYGNLTLSSSGNKTAAGAMTMAGNFFLSNATFIGNNYTHNVGGDWTMSSGTFTNTGTTISINGGTTHNVTSTGAFNNLTVNASGGSVIVGSDLTVNATLTLSAGTITTGSNKVIVSSTGSVTRTSGHVNGFLQKHVGTGPVGLTFEVGDASLYAPVDVAFANVTSAGDLVISTTSGDHPSIGTSFLDPSKSVNRYWSATNSGVAFTSYDVTLHFLGGDLDGGANPLNFEVSKYNNPTWSLLTFGTRTSTLTQALGLTSFSDFAVGERKNYTISASAGANGSISPTGAVSVKGGNNQLFTITPVANYHVDSVLVDGVNAGPVGTYTFTNVSANHDIRAVFAIDQFTITATAGTNGILAPSGSVLVNYGANQAFTITPNLGYHVDSVLVDGVNQGQVASYTFTNVTANHTIRAVYAIDQFTITATAGANGTLSPSGSVVVNYGANQAFTITPNIGYHVDSVLVDGVNQGQVASYTFTNVTANHTIRTVYAIDQFTITATAGANGTLSPSGSVVVNYGANQAFTITSNIGYHVDSVLVDGVNQGQVASYTFTNVTANHTIQTVYAIDQFTITATAGANGSITPNGAVVVNYGSNQAFTITPNLGYHVDSVLVDGVNQGQVASYTFTNVTANHTIRAVYAIDQFTITATAGDNGTLSPSGSVVVNYGANQAFTITPNIGYHVDSVLVDGVNQGQVASYTFTNVTANHTIRTVYAIDQFTITATAGANGTLSPSGSVVVNYGANQAFTITSNIGYHVDSVLVDGVNQGQVASYTFTNVTANHTIQTVYAIDQFTITATAGANGTLSPSGSVVVNYGANQAFTITSNIGYHVDSVLVDGVNQGQVASYTFTNVTANHTIRAVYAIDQFTITATAGANGTLSPSGSVVVNYGANQAFTITPNIGYHVDSVLVDGVNQGQVASYTFTNVTANHTIRTVYAIDQFTITATAGANGTLSPSGSVVVNYGANQAFTITPNLGYHVDSVLVDGVNQGQVASYTFTNVTANHTIRAVYAIDQFTITATAGANGTLSPSGSVVVNYGANQAFTITPNIGYHVDSVLVDGVNQGQVASYTFTNVTANHTIRTVYAIDQFTITATAGANGTLSPSGSVVVNYGANQAFTITSNIGYHVDSVLVDGVNQGQVASYTFTNVTANHTIQTVYAIDQFTITATAGANGTLSPTGAVVVNYGANQAFTITPNLGYHVDSVLVDGVNQGQVASYTFTNVTANHTIRTVYAIDQFTIVATTGLNGSISPSGTVVADYGSDHAFTITPNTGYFIADVQVDSVSVGQVTSYAFNSVTANHTIHATFAITQYTITATAGSNGSIAPSGAVLVDHGASQGFTITPNLGYHIDSVLVDGVSAGPVGSYAFTNVTADHTIRAVFAIDQFTITATAGSNGSLTPNGSVIVNYGGNQGFTIAANIGHHIDSVLVDGVDQGPVGSYTFSSVTADHTIRTVYAIDQFTIVATTGLNGSITPSGSVVVNYGADQAFTITPDIGYFVADVQVDSVSVGQVTSHTFNNVTANHTIHATFAITQYTITATAGSNGNIAPNGSVLVDHGASQSFTITANTGYHVDSVLIDGVSAGTVGSYTFNNVTANHTIRTVYAIDQFTINATTGLNGSITPNGPVVANYGSDQSFTITPNTGYFIADVQVDSVSVGQVNSYTFNNVTANHTIHATFAITQYTITATAGANGSVAPSGVVLVNHGDSQSFTITPGIGYHIDSVLVDGVNQGSVGSYTFTNVTATHTIRTVYAIDLFTITATTGVNGSISPSGSVSVGYGGSQGFTITPNTGYFIADVQVDSASVGQVTSYAFNNVTANHTIHATFAITQYTITATAGSNGSIAPSGAVLVNHGASQGFTVTANIGYHIDSVLVDGVDAGPVGTYSFTNVTANHSIRSVYAVDQFTITSTTGPNGSITPSGSVAVSFGSDQSFTITPNSGYYIADVQVDSVSVGQVTSHTFTNVTANHTIHATFAITQYTITASAGSNGGIAPTGAVLVDHGGSQSYTITPNTGYYIADVQVDSVSVGQVTSYTFNNVTANHTIHASFAITRYTITASAGANGSITPNGAVLVDHGASQGFTITPNIGYHIDSVLVDGVDAGPVGTYSFTNVTANHSIRTVYAVDQFTITATTGSNGSITPSGSVPVNYGSDQAFAITPSAGYFVADVQVDSVSVGQVTSYTFNNVTANHTIHATFAITQYTITATAGSNGSIAPSGAVPVNHGASESFTITPNTGYYILDVLVDTVSVGAVTSYTFTNVTANHLISAAFAQILNPVPVLTSISPASGYRGDTLDVTYQGHHFISGVTTLPLISGIASGGLTILSDSVLVHHIVIGVNASPGAYGFYVQNSAPGGGNSDTVVFSVLNHAPSAAQLLVPASGDTLVIENLGPAVGFTWHASADADLADALTYSVHLSGPGIDSVLSGLTDTTLQWSISSMLQSGSSYWWTVNVTDGQVVTASPDTFTFHVTSLVAVLDGGKDLPKTYALFQNFPNPFNPTTVVRFDLPQVSSVRVSVYNLIGQEVAVLIDESTMGAGHHEVSMDAGALSSGVYLYRITAKPESGDVFSSVKKMVLVK